MRYRLLIIVAVLSFASQAFAQDWAKKMFAETTHNFGSVARGAEVKYTFVIENSYEEPVRISSVRTSCPCTSPKVNKYLLKSWEKADLTVEIKTRLEPGRKDGTVSIVFDVPSRPDIAPAEVQVHTQAYIRRDVVVEPGVVQFGTVDAGVGWRQQAAIKYAGRGDWQILRVESNNPHLQAQVVEKYRRQGQVAFEIGYDLFVTLDATIPPGYLREDIYLITNDPNPTAVRFPVAVEGLISSAMSVHPNPLNFGAVTAGESVPKNLIIKSKSPFRILSVQSTDNRRLQWKMPQEAKPVQVLPITFLAPAEEGKFSGRIRIQTDQERLGPLEVDVNAQVTPKK
jgi:hypothetical protein